MNLRIRQGGQTGVDRGAWLAARDASVERCGWMPNDERDELGRIPDEVRADLRPLHAGGLSARTERNVWDADAVLIVVPDATRGCTTSGTRLTWRLAKRFRCPHLMVDRSGFSVPRAVNWVLGLGRSESALDLMVAGPRASLWSEGEETARELVRLVIESMRTSGQGRPT